MPASSAPVQPAAADTAPDPWFQDRFAQRIGGANFAKGSGIYKFELIKRAKRQALADQRPARLCAAILDRRDTVPAPPFSTAVNTRR